MKDLTIAVGTVSAQKLGYVRKILKKLGVRAVLLPANVSSGVSEQPLSSAETKRGARKRAVLALTEHPVATLGLGIEVGYGKNKAGRFEMFCWAAIVDKEREVAQLSHAFVTPDFHQAILKKGGFLGDHVRRYHAATKNSIRQRVGEVIRLREPFITTAVEHALLRYLNK